METMNVETREESTTEYALVSHTYIQTHIFLTSTTSFVRSFTRGSGTPLAVFRRDFNLLPALRPRLGPVHYSPLNLGLVLYIYRA